MTEPERAALEHIRRVAEAVIESGDFVPPTTPPPVTPSVTPPPAQPPVSPPVGESQVAILNVPYLTQFGADADKHIHDSAAAAGAMLVRAYTGENITPNEFFDTTRQSDKALTISQVSIALSKYGVSSRQRARMRILDISAALASGRPLLLPLSNAVLREAGLTNESTDAPQYVIAVGLDMENIYVHDPLRHGEGGEGLRIPILTLYQAWEEVGRVVSSYERTGLIPANPLRRFVSATTVVNIRSGPGTNHGVVGRTETGEIFEASKIVGDWGQIGEGRWLSLRYTRDI